MKYKGKTVIEPKKSTLRKLVEQAIKEYGVLEAGTPDGSLFEPTQDGLDAFVEQIKSRIKVPVISVAKGSMYTPDELYITFGLQSKEQWPNNIFENSKYFRMIIGYTGTMEVHRDNLTEKSSDKRFAFQHIPLKFRKTKARNADDAISKIEKFIKQVMDYYNSIGFVLEGSKPLGTLKESNDIDTLLSSWIEKLNQTAKDDDEKSKHTLPSSVFDFVKGAKWIKVITTTYGGKGQKSVFAFVNPETGDIYKPASWNAPAKGIRGNLKDPKIPLRAGDLYRYR